MCWSWVWIWFKQIKRENIFKTTGENATQTAHDISKEILLIVLGGIMAFWLCLKQNTHLLEVYVMYLWIQGYDDWDLLYNSLVPSPEKWEDQIKQNINC